MSIEEKVQRKPYEISYTNVNITNWDAYNLEDVEDESIRRFWDHLYALFTFKDRKTVPPASETPITEIELADLSFEVVDSTKNYILRINGDNSSVIQLDR